MGLSLARCFEQGEGMKKNLWLQKIIFTLTSGSLLFYLVSFDSSGQPIQQGSESEQCKISLQKIRSGRPLALKKQQRVMPQNVLKLSAAEQRLISHYIHLTGITLVKEGAPNPFRVSSYKMESPNRQTLGYKVVLDAENEKEDIVTYYMSEKGEILFWYWDSYQPIQEWTCETQRK